LPKAVAPIVPTEIPSPVVAIIVAPSISIIRAVVVNIDNHFAAVVFSPTRVIIHFYRVVFIGSFIGINICKNSVFILKLKRFFFEIIFIVIR